METIVTNRAKVKEAAEVKGFSFKEMVLMPLKSGILGFTTFFTILAITKYLSYIIGSTNVFTIDIEDIMLSFVGFILVALIRLLENFKES